MFFINKELEDFILQHLHTDLHTLLLKKSPFPEISMAEIVQQIKGRKVAEKKFPFLLKHGIVFPPNLNLEQTSSQATAEYKAQNLHGTTFLDLTCGFGIDAWFLSKQFDEVTLVEQNQELLNLVRNNWEILGRKAEFINEKLEVFLQQNSRKYSLVYLDPARRDEHKNKVFLLEDLSPNLLEIQDDLMKISDEMIIKLSPLIDLKYLVSVLKNVWKIEILAVKNDVKEVLVFIKTQENSEKILCKCVNLETDEPPFEFYFDEEPSATEYSEPLKYLYLPNNSVLKSGAFRLISEQFKVKKLHPNTHFYTSENYIPHFPGRILEIESIDSKQIEKGNQFNIISKNNPLTPDEIRKKYKLKDGGNDYLIFTQTQKGKIILKSV